MGCYIPTTNVLKCPVFNVILLHPVALCPVLFKRLPFIPTHPPKHCYLNSLQTASHCPVFLYRRIIKSLCILIFLKLWFVRLLALRPLLAYCASLGWQWRWLWRSRCNVEWQGKPKFSEETCPSATFVLCVSYASPFLTNIGNRPQTLLCCSKAKRCVESSSNPISLTVIPSIEAHWPVNIRKKHSALTTVYGSLSFSLSHRNYFKAEDITTIRSVLHLRKQNSREEFYLLGLKCM
jgi:hypothetical protein